MPSVKFPTICQKSSRSTTPIQCLVRSSHVLMIRYLVFAHMLVLHWPTSWKGTKPPSLTIKSRKLPRSFYFWFRMEFLSSRRTLWLHLQLSLSRLKMLSSPFSKRLLESWSNHLINIPLRNTNSSVVKLLKLLPLCAPVSVKKPLWKFLTRLSKQCLLSKLNNLMTKIVNVFTSYQPGSVSACSWKVTLPNTYPMCSQVSLAWLLWIPRWVSVVRMLFSSCQMCWTKLNPLMKKTKRLALSLMNLKKKKQPFRCSLFSLMNLASLTSNMFNKLQLCSSSSLTLDIMTVFDRLVLVHFPVSLSVLNLSKATRFPQSFSSLQENITQISTTRWRKRLRLSACAVKFQLYARL